mmetsp:Transcript_8361/g.10578  ORF Transcript_8361/g.10578 Transcript_8361/m.10578 type:complete len:232 (-) Transcript_8361:33-728(-)
MASNMLLVSVCSTNTILYSSEASNSKSSISFSMAASNSASSSILASTSSFPLRSYINSTDPCSAIFPPFLFTALLTSAFERLSLSVNTLITMDAPPIPYASKVDSEKLAVLASDAFLIALLILSTGTLLALAALIISPRTLFESGSGPPCFAAMISLLPKTAFIFAFLASVLDFVFARTAAARPIKRGDNLAVDDCVGVGTIEKALELPVRRRRSDAEKSFILFEYWLVAG